MGHKFDGLVLIGNCDKIVPGMLMAAARLNIPAIRRAAAGQDAFFHKFRNLIQMGMSRNNLIVGTNHTNQRLFQILRQIPHRVKQ